MDASTLAFVMLVGLAVAAAATFAFLVRRQRKQMEADQEAALQRARENIAERLAAAPSGPPIHPFASQSVERRSTVRSFSAPASSPAPQQDYLTQHLIWQSLNTPATAPAPEPSYEPSCRASSYVSGGGGDFGGGGASSSWDSGSSSSSNSSSDSSYSSSSDSSSSYSSD